MNPTLSHLIEQYVPCNDEDAAHRSFILHFVRTHEHPFSRAHLHGHLTSSAIIVNQAGTRVLLGHHRKLDRWLQFGGHGEPEETDPESVALREVQEETGIHYCDFHPDAPRPFDLDVHTIPEHKGVPEHKH